MSNPGPEADNPFSYEMHTKERLDELGKQFESLLLAQASRSAPGRPIGTNDLDEAYRELITTDRESFRDAQGIISRAIRENRVGERLAYGMTTSLFALGLILLVIGAWHGQVASVLAGSIVELLFPFPLRTAVSIREENLRMRVLGMMIDKGGDARTMASILKNTLMKSSPERS